jgi:hypothetical protein
MQDLEGQGYRQQGQDDSPDAETRRPSLAVPLLFLLFVGMATIILLEIGARDGVVPLLFLSLPVATLWLIVIDRRRRD